MSAVTERSQIPLGHLNADDVDAQLKQTTKRRKVERYRKIAFLYRLGDTWLPDGTHSNGQK